MQLTDFENAAYVVFVVLLTRVILSYKLDFLIPLSKVKPATQFRSFIKYEIRYIISEVGHLGDDMSFYQVDENMKVAQKRNAVQEGMFYFRKDIYKGG